MAVCFQIALAFALVFSRCVATGTFNFSLDPKVLQNVNSLDVLQDSTLQVFCTPEQGSVYVYNLPQENYEDCLIDDSTAAVTIGSCLKSPLQIPIVSLRIAFGNLVSYEIGKKYYFAAFNYANGDIVDNNPCANGVKFSLNVVESLNDEVVTSSPVVVPPSPSPSLTFMETMSSSLPITTGLSESSFILMATPTMTSLSQTVSTTSSIPVRPIPTSLPSATPTRPTVTRPTLDDPLADSIANHAHFNQSLAFLSLLLTTLTLLLLLL